MTLFIDTSVVLTAWGRDHPSRTACRSVISGGGAQARHTSVECAQEIVFHRLRTVGRATALTDGANLHRAFVLHCPTSRCSSGLWNCSIRPRFAVATP